MRKVFLAVAFCWSWLGAPGAERAFDYETVREKLREFVAQNRDEIERKAPSALVRECCGKKGDSIRVLKDGTRIVGSWMVLAQENVAVASYSYREWGDGEKGRWEREDRIDVSFEAHEGALTIKNSQIGAPEKKENSFRFEVRQK